MPSGQKVNSKTVGLLEARKLSALVAHDLSGFHRGKEVTHYETNKMVTGNQENEIR